MPELKEYLEQAKLIKYVPPTIPLDQWDRTEIFYGAISETMTSKYQLKAALIVCDMFPPLKLFFKSQLKSYMKVMNERSSSSISQVQR